MIPLPDDYVFSVGDRVKYSEMDLTDPKIYHGHITSVDPEGRLTMYFDEIKFTSRVSERNQKDRLSPDYGYKDRMGQLDITYDLQPIE